ncbi:MAG TPA: hypothetical protein VGE01_06710 [Fimbriimonas sp.]
MKKTALLSALTLAACAPTGAQNWSQADTWAFEPGPDTFSSSALLDLRSLNEKAAGESGFVKVDANGDFLLGNGRPVRFWCVNTGVEREKPFVARPLGRKTEPKLDRHARFLAKRGVNMVRLHAHIEPKPEQPVDTINESERDWIWRTVAAMKKEGIYTTISPYWAIPVKIGKGWGVPGADQENAAALLFFEPKLQQAYFGWLRKLYAEKNPYTGVPLSQEPAVAILQIQNEDSLLFWTINNLKGEARQILQRQYANWLAKKYGSLTAAAQRWQGHTLPGDDLPAGRADFANVYEMTQPRQGGIHRRLSDQTEFWARTMYDFNKKTADFLRNELGCKQLINAGNWRTADSARLFDAERWSYTANEVDAVNRYFGGIHKGPAEGWNIRVGDKFTSDTVLRDPNPFPLTLRQTAGRPMLITESAWVMPNGYASEGPLLVAAYQSLTGIDGYYWFATGDDEWTEPASGNGYDPGQAKWLFGNPDMLGTFPAAALMYRKGYVKRGAPAVVEHRSLQNVFERNVPVIVEEGGFDPNRDMGDVAPTSSVKTPVDPLAFLVGPVQVVYGSDPAKTKVLGLSPYVNRAQGLVKSNTGQIELHYKENYLLIDAPSVQGAVSFFEKNRVATTSDVQITSKNEFASVLVVAMDDQPLKTSKKILVQVGTRSRPTGWSEKKSTLALEGGRSVEGFEVVSTGGAPWRVEKADMTVTVNNPKLRKGTVLDMNGMPMRTLDLCETVEGRVFSFPEDAMYVVLQ